MQTISWLAFGLSNQVTRCCAHFFPSADSITAPYPSTCSLTLFGRDLPEKTVVLEGGRLSNPDGVWLEDAFPVLKTGVSGFFGIQIEIGSVQPRLDLSGSGCVIELSSQGHLTRFWPTPMIPGLGGAQSARAGWLDSLKASALQRAEGRAACGPWPGLAIRDPFQASSLLVVNKSAKQIAAYVRRIVSAPDQEGDAAEPQRVEVPAGGIVEHSFPPDLYDSGFKQECSWGPMQICPVEFFFEPGQEGAAAEGIGVSPLRSEADSISEEVACYMLYRDVGSSRIASVVAM